MINKKIAFSVGIVGAVVAVSFAAAYSGNPFKKLRAADGPYELVLNNAVAESTLTSSYQNKVTTSVTTSEGNDISLALVLAKSASGAYVDLAPRGMIYNFESSAGQISGITGITVTYSSGSVSLKTSPFSLDGGAFLGEAAPLTNGVEYTLPVSAKYFQIIAGDNGALITSVVINYACDEAYTNVKVADGTYVGKTNDVTYEMIINNGATTLRTLDAQVPETYTGTTTLTNDQQLSFAFTYQGNQINYVTAISANGQTLTPVSTGGFPSITFYREYEVENFDSYTTTGQGYNSEATKTQTSGLRAAFYSDYSVASGGDSPIGDSTWALSHSDDYLLLGENQGRNNTNCAILKGSTNGLRYITMNSYYGVPQAIGKGAVLSF